SSCMCVFSFLILFVSVLLLSPSSSFFFLNATATTEIYTLSLHDALPICPLRGRLRFRRAWYCAGYRIGRVVYAFLCLLFARQKRSEEHTSELQSRENLVCRLLLEKKKKKHIKRNTTQK